MTEAAAVCNLPCREVERAREKWQRRSDSFYFFSLEHLDKGTEMPSESLESNTYKTIFLKGPLHAFLILSKKWNFSFYFYTSVIVNTLNLDGDVAFACIC